MGKFMSNAQEALENDLDRRMLTPAKFGIWHLCHAVAKRRLLLSPFSEIYQSSVRERFARLTQIATILCFTTRPRRTGTGKTQQRSVTSSMLFASIRRSGAKGCGEQIRLPMQYEKTRDLVFLEEAMPTITVSMSLHCEISSLAMW